MREYTLPTYTNEMPPLSEFVVTERRIAKAQTITLDEYIKNYKLGSAEWFVDFSDKKIFIYRDAPVEEVVAEGWSITWEKR